MTEHSGEAWWDGFYHDLLADILLEREDPAALKATCDFLWDRLALKPGSVVFDQCCGIGSVTMPLAARGARGIGADLSKVYIDRATAQAAAEGADCTFECADAFTFVPKTPCDAVFNWYSSFGYADSDAQNQEMLQRAFEALKPGGRFALEGPNMVGVLRHFKPIMLKRRVVKGREVVLLRESALDLARGRLTQLWTYLLPDGTRKEDRSALRLYLPHTIAEMLEGCGFVDVRLCAGVDGAPLTPDSMRCILTARRPS